MNESDREDRPASATSGGGGKNALERLLSEMTLEEKALLTCGRDMWATQPIERLGIPSLWMADGPHGLRRAPATHAMGYGDQLPATCFPTASALSASWDVELMHEVGNALGDEARALGVHILLGPGVNIKRSVLGGRNFEYFSEDPYLSGKLGAAYINGVQERGVGTSLKHFAANDVETERMWANSQVDERTLNEIHLTPFEIAVREAQPWTVMACYNRVQGVYGTESADLLTQKLKEEWAFDGIVISDWDAVVNRVQGLRAGMHVEMPGKPTRLSNREIEAAVRRGDLDEDRLDEIVRDILRVVLGAHEKAQPSDDQNLEAHHAFARRVASESITLLKNEASVLPMGRNRYRRIAVIGEFAVNPRFQGNGSSEVKPPRLDSLIDILQAEHTPEFEFDYARGYSLADDHDESMIDEARRLAAGADIALVLVGLPLHYESEGIDRKHIDLPPAQTQLIEAVAEAQPATAVLLTNGSAVAMPWAERVPAIVEAWLGGQAGAGAVADVVFGRVNPSGRLAETFPRRLEDTPAYLNFPAEDGEVLYGERVFVGYRYYDARRIDPLFPFGHGLSYTEFSYSELEIEVADSAEGPSVAVRATITNTGAMAGKEVVQLYLGDPQSSVRRPEKELRGFRKVALEPGQSTVVEFTLEYRDFAYYSCRYRDWIAESGDFDFLVGASSRDIRLRKTQALQFRRAITYRFTSSSFFREFWYDPTLKPMLIDLMPDWLASQAPEGAGAEAARVPDFLREQPLIKYVYFTGGEISAEDVSRFVERCNALTFTP